jgi:hypothetical protein
MRIITLGRVAGIGDGDDYIYEGNAYLLRFSLESPDQFFAFQLPFIVDTLGIDVRQIMRMELLGDGQSGLRQVMVCISFEDAACDAELLESAINKVCAAPSAPNNTFTLRDDVLRQRMIQFFLLAPKPVKTRFLKDFAETIRHKAAKSANLRHERHVEGFLYRVSFEAGSPPSLSEWRNTLLFCSERLRRAFLQERLDRVTFTAIPNTEDEYRVEADLLLPVRTKVYKARSELRFRSRPTRATNAVLSFEPETGRPEHKLKEPEKAALHEFDELDTKGRLLVWNKHLSKFFK